MSLSNRPSSCASCDAGVNFALFYVGQEIVVQAPAPEGPFCAVFEDDGQTGYFYALNTSLRDQRIQDAMQIYSVANVTDRDHPSTAKVGWSKDNMKVALLINGHPHAVFDFHARQGFCRTGFPPAPSNGIWSVPGHAWSESAMELFA